MQLCATYVDRKSVEVGEELPPKPIPKRLGLGEEAF